MKKIFSSALSKKEMLRKNSRNHPVKRPGLYTKGGGGGDNRSFGHCNEIICVILNANILLEGIQILQ